MEKESIGARLKRLRTALNMTQDDVGKIADISKQTLYKYEKGIITNIPSDKIEQLAKIYHVSQPYIMGWEKENDTPHVENDSVKIPVLGRVVAGEPIEAIEDLQGYVYVDKSLTHAGKLFALEVRGNSMTPTLHEGDIVIVRQQPDVESGEIAVVMVNGGDATVKEIRKAADGITLIGHNAIVYPRHFYSNEEIISIPITIAGKVIEFRRSM